jgi:hypothetical protein
LTSSVIVMPMNVSSLDGAGKAQSG